MIDKIFSALDEFNRHNLIIIRCAGGEEIKVIDLLSKKLCPPVNIGESLARILQKSDPKFLSLTAQETFSEIIENNSKQVYEGKPPVVCIYNLGILFEPEINLDALQLIKRHSQNHAIIIIWAHIIDPGPILHWGINNQNFQINLSEINPFILDYKK